MKPNSNGVLPLNGMDELIRLQMSMQRSSENNGNMHHHNAAVSADAFSNLMMNPTITTAASGNATNFNNAQVEKTTTTSPMSGSGSQTILPQSASYHIHGTPLINSRVFEVKTGEPTSNVIQTSHYQHHHDNCGGNHSDMTRSSSEPMLESIGGAGLAGNRTGTYASDNSSNNMTEDSMALHRRNSEPAPNMFEDTFFDQLYSEGSAPTGGRDIFADGFHSPPLGPLTPVATKLPSLTLGEHPSRPRASSEPLNWDLFDAPSPIPLEEKSTLFRLQSSRHPDTTTVTVATKTGEDSDQNKHVFNRGGRSRQHRRNPPLKRSRSADPLLMQAVTADYVSHPSDGYKTNDCDDILRYFNPEEELGFHSGEKIKRRRSEPLPTEDLLSQLDKGGKDEYSQDRTGGLTSSFTSGRLLEIDNHVETGNIRQTSDLVQLILGMKKDDSVQGDSNNMPLMHTIENVGTHNEDTAFTQVTSNLPSPNVSQVTGRYLPVSKYHAEPMTTQQTKHLSNGSEMNFNPIYTDPPMHQNMNLSYSAPSTVPSAIGGSQNVPPATVRGSQMMQVQQPPVNFLNPNIASGTSNENALANILDAVTETHNNLQILQSAVARCQDPKAVESITRAFELTSACSQFVLLSQYDTAHNLLNQAWTHIKVVESRLSLSGVPTSNFSAGLGQNRYELPLMASIDKPLCLPQKSKKKKAVKTPKPKTPKLEELPPQNKDDPEIIMTRLNALMERTIMSQKNLQKYDKQNGLPRSHAQTMISTSRSRKQLQKGIAIKKRDGKPLSDSTSTIYSTKDRSKYDSNRNNRI